MAAKERKAKKKGIGPAKSGRAGRAAGKSASPPSPGSAGPSNMMDRVISSIAPPTRMRMVATRELLPRRKGKPIKSRRKT